MSVTEALHQRPQVPVDPERAYQEWAGELPERLPRTDWDQVDPHPSKEWLWAAELADTPGGSVLADYAEGLTEEDLAESLVLELIAGCERIKSWATARQAELITEMHTRSTGAPRPEYLDDAMRVRLGITGRSAGLLEDRARRLAHAPEVLKALKAGWIDVRKADVLLHRTDTLSTLEARAVQRKFIPTADRRTPSQLRADVDRAVLAIDPETAEERHKAAKKTRTVTLNPASDGMAWLSAYLPAPEAMAAFTVLDVLAGESSPEDDRDVGARRADAFTRIFTEILDGGQTPSGCTLGTRQGVRPHLVITVAASTLAGEDDEPAHLAGYGAITAAEARRFAGYARTTTIVTDPEDGSYLAHHEGPPEDDAGAAIAAELARRSMLRRRLPWLYPEDLWDRERARQSAYDARYIIERATKDGDGDPVAFLCASGLLAVDAYAPTAELRKHLVLRDRTCRFPGCSTPGWKCQIDHIVPFTKDLPAWAQTIETNLHLLCRRHHQLKTSGDWRVWRDAYGATHWIIPGGYHHMVQPDQIHAREESALYRIALEGLRSELGDDVENLIPGDGMEPGYIDDLNPADLAAEDCLDTIARKLADAAGTGPLPDTDTSQIAAHWRARTRPQQPPPRPWLDHVPRRVPPPARPSTPPTADDDEAERPSF